MRSGVEHNHFLNVSGINWLLMDAQHIISQSRFTCQTSDAGLSWDRQKLWQLKWIPQLNNLPNFSHIVQWLALYMVCCIAHSATVLPFLHHNSLIFPSSESVNWWDQMQKNWWKLTRPCHHLCTKNGFYSSLPSVTFFVVAKMSLSHQVLSPHCTSIPFMFFFPHKALVSDSDILYFPKSSWHSLSH